MGTPTTETYSTLEHAYKYFNKTLFNGRLPPCMLTLQRKDKRVYGFFSPERFDQGEGTRSADELAMNPIHFLKRDTKAVLSTLVHEMVHLEQSHFGKPGRGRYHNKEWGEWMKRVGLHPSNTGKPGGKETGQQMTHYVVEGGEFERACKALLGGGFKLSWGEIDPTKAAVEGVVSGGGTEPEPDKSNRIRFNCGGCAAKAWGKPSLKLICGVCKVPMVPMVPKARGD